MALIRLLHTVGGVSHPAIPVIAIDWNYDERVVVRITPIPHFFRTLIQIWYSPCRSVTLKDQITSHLPQQRVIVSLYNLITTFLPVLLGYYVMAVLVQLPGTKLHRLALLPVIVWSTITAGMTLDFSFGHPEFAHINQGLAVSLVFMSYVHY
ncbi:hypothetical protein V8B97DRAFT_1529727, partial [Scleroderma yunnanense]